MRGAGDGAGTTDTARSARRCAMDPTWFEWWRLVTGVFDYVIYGVEVSITWVQLVLGG